jgi:hypothetical protein
VSLVTEPPAADGARRVVLRLATIDPRPILTDLAGQGIAAVEPGGLRQ